MPTVAILGASADRSKFGNKSLRAHRDAGYTVYPVNPKGGEVEGVAAFTSVGDVPVVRLDRISVYLPPAILLRTLPDIAAKGCEELWLNPGTESGEVIEEAKKLGLKVVVGCSIIDVGKSPRDYGDV
jgi:predicted CoA-binding protein